MKSTLLYAIAMLLTVNTFANKLIIQASGTSFTPNTGTIQLGDTVIFQWVDGFHTTTSTAVPTGAASWDEVLSSSATSYMYIPTVAGTYSYKCTPHESMGMTGTFTVTNLTGVGEVSKQDVVQVFPNPASEQLNIKISSAKNFSYNITTLDGRIMQQTENAKTDQLLIDVTAYAKGVYLININSEGKRITKKFTID